MRFRVSIVRAESYEEVALRFSISALVAQLGGWGEFVKPGESVLLKPNLLAARTPERGVTTHPLLVKIVAQQLLDFGAKVALGDSPGGADRGLERVFKNTGMTDVAQSLGIEEVHFETEGARHIRSDDGYDLYITKARERFDRIISLSKLKTHSMATYTGAVKNLFGFVPGFRKASYHKEFPLPTKFVGLILAIYKNVPVTLNIMDAVVGMEGNGPASGDLRDVKLLLASRNGLALDRVAQRIIGIADKRSILNILAKKKGFEPKSLDEIDIIGGNLDEFILNPPFKLPPRLPEAFMPEWLIKRAARLVWIRPKPIDAKCTRCGTCVRHCPVEAISMRENAVPFYDYSKCITCLCCHELCPDDAIELERSWIAKRID